jgi:hypothetical protein
LKSGSTDSYGIYFLGCIEGAARGAGTPHARGGDARDRLTAGFRNVRRTPPVFVGLSTRAPEKYRYNGLTTVEIMLDPDALLWVDGSSTMTTTSVDSTVVNGETRTETVTNSAGTTVTSKDHHGEVDHVEQDRAHDHESPTVRRST